MPEKPKPKSPSSPKNSQYKVGQHGSRRKEQQRLSEKFQTSVTHKTHESEHAIGYKALNHTSKEKRRSTAKARKLENEAWAYQEQKEFHRGHTGTGTRKKIGQDGFTSKSYRESQRRLLEAGDVSSAIQLNQLSYAFQAKFQDQEDTLARRAADSSYKKMVKHMDKVTYAREEKTKIIKLDPVAKAEMYLAREAARTGKWPTEAQIKAAKKKFGLKDS